MKKVLFVILMAAFIIPAMVSCKKGPNDPGVSLKSRDSRLIGAWKLVSFTGTKQTYAGLDPITISYRFDGNNYTATSSGTSISGTGSFTMEILKDGGFTYSEGYTPSGGTASVYSGTDFWYWADNDNNKIAVRFGDGGVNLFTSGQYNIDKLSTKELILTFYNYQNNNGDIYSDDWVYNFEPS